MILNKTRADILLWKNFHLKSQILLQETKILQIYTEKIKHVIKKIILKVNITTYTEHRHKNTGPSV